MMFEVVRKLIEDVNDTQKEAIFKAYLNPERTCIKSWPSSHKKACVLMQWVGSFFSEEIIYSEKEVNMIMKSLFPDFVMLRRMSVDIGLLSRDLSGSSYQKRNP